MIEMESTQLEENSNPQETLKNTSADVEKLIDTISTIASEKTNTFWEKLKIQLRDIGKTIMASILALVVAVVSSFIFNSQYSQDFQIAVDDIRTKLPTEAEKILVRQISDKLGKNRSLLDELQQEQFRQKEKNQIDALLGATLKEQFELSKERYSQQLIFNEKNTRQIEFLNSELNNVRTTSIKGHATNKALVKTLKHFIKQGEAISSKQSPDKNTNNWLKNVYYFVHTLPGGNSEQQLKTIKKAMTSIIDGKSEYNNEAIKISETLIILSTLRSLAEAAVLGQL